MKEYINERLDEVEAEWDRPLKERLLKVLFVGGVTVIASWMAERTYDRSCERRKAKEEIERLEQMLQK